MCRTKHYAKTSKLELIKNQGKIPDKINDEILSL